MAAQAGFGRRTDGVGGCFASELTRGAAVAHGKGGGEILTGGEAAGHGDIGDAGAGGIADEFGGVFEPAMIEEAEWGEIG